MKKQTTCLKCNKQLIKRQRMFCSISCRNWNNGKKTGGSNCANLWFNCEECGKEYRVPPIRTKGKQKTRHCSRLCHNRAIARETNRSWDKNPMFIDGRVAYKKLRKMLCEYCGSKNFLHVHHIDKNRYNNLENNLVTLCAKCHRKTHEVRCKISGRFLPSGSRPF